MQTELRSNIQDLVFTTQNNILTTTHTNLKSE